MLVLRARAYIAAVKPPHHDLHSHLRHLHLHTLSRKFKPAATTSISTRRPETGGVSGLSHRRPQASGLGSQVLSPWATQRASRHVYKLKLPSEPGSGLTDPEFRIYPIRPPSFASFISPPPGGVVSASWPWPNGRGHPVSSPQRAFHTGYSRTLAFRLS